MNRNENILKYINKDGIGIEIGPSHNPVAPKKEGFNVHIIDHASQDDLKKKYIGHNVNLDNIESVDYVWRGERYAELTGHANYYDWIIASHVIEHAPDLIAFINECDSILKEDGVLSLVVPDKRFCFDHFRPLSGLSRVIDSHLSQSVVHSPGVVAEYFMHVVAKEGHIAWPQGAPGHYTFVHSRDNAIEEMNNVMRENIYIDVHGWCFVPHSFRLLIEDLHSLGFIKMRELDFSVTQGSEFYMTLSREGTGPSLSRMEMSEQAERELRGSEGDGDASMDLKYNTLKQQYDALLSSNSWKITRPLRALRRLFK